MKYHTYAHLTFYCSWSATLYIYDLHKVGKPMRSLAINKKEKLQVLSSCLKDPVADSFHNSWISIVNDSSNSSVHCCTHILESRPASECCVWTRGPAPAPTTPGVVPSGGGKPGRGAGCRVLRVAVLRHVTSTVKPIVGGTWHNKQHLIFWKYHMIIWLSIKRYTVSKNDLWLNSLMWYWSQKHLNN